MSDIVERLRSEIPPGRAWCREAADEIERLRDVIVQDTINYDKLRAATIEECAQVAQGYSRDDIAADIRALKEQK